MEEIIPIRKKKQEKHTDFNLISVAVLVGIALLIIGVATATKKVADWGAEHQIVKQRVIDLQVRLPYRIEKIEAPQPVVEVIVPTPYSELSSTEQKIIDLWGYKDGMVAIAIFDCGESGLDQYAVSLTGDLGIAQVNWHFNGKIIKERLGYSSADMLTSIDKNLEAAHLIWDRADGKEGDGKGSWVAWSGYKNDSYLRCFE